MGAVAVGGVCRRNDGVDTAQLLLLRWTCALLVLLVSMGDGDFVESASSVENPTTSTNSTTTRTALFPWQECQLLLAPSPVSGWGVFAGRSYQKGEIVEMAPGVIPMPQDSPSMVHSALDDYVYGYYRIVFPEDSSASGHPELQSLYAVMLGMGMVYNHDPIAPNVEYTTFGREPAPDVPTAANAIGFVATRTIEVGEELFSTYGATDGGRDWFTRRKLPLVTPSSSSSGPTKIPQDEWDRYQHEYCSKIAAGVGRPTWEDRMRPLLPPTIPFWMDTQWLPPWDAELGGARAKVAVTAGGRVELGTGLAVDQRLIQTSPLAAIAVTWQDLLPEHQAALRLLRSNNQLVVQYNQWDSPESWRRLDGFHSWETVALLPIGGSWGLVHRGGSSTGEETTNNCRLVIRPEANLQSVTVAVEVIATKNIGVGDVLRLDLPSGGSSKEEQLLQDELRRMGREPSSGRFSTHPFKDEPSTGIRQEEL